MTTTPDVLTVLAELPDASLVYEDAMAVYFGRRPKTLRKAVARGELPAPFRMFGRRAWTAGAVVRHLLARQEQATEQQEATAQRVARMGP